MAGFVTKKRVLKSYTMLTFSGWTAIVAAEAGFFDVLVQYWAEGSFPQAATSKHGTH